MTKTEVPMITDLSEENRQLVLKQTEELLHMLSQCEGYVRGYASGAENVAKLFGMVWYTEEALVILGTSWQKRIQRSFPRS